MRADLHMLHYIEGRANDGRIRGKAQRPGHWDVCVTQCCKHLHRCESRFVPALALPPRLLRAFACTTHYGMHPARSVCIHLKSRPAGHDCIITLWKCTNSLVGMPSPDILFPLHALMPAPFQEASCAAHTSCVRSAEHSCIESPCFAAYSALITHRHGWCREFKVPHLQEVGGI